MRTLVLPATDLAVSPLCLGGVPFGHTLDEPASFALLDRFVELGGNFIDTARVYSDWVPGEKRRSERILGDWLRARRNRAGLVIATKGAHPFIESLAVPRTSAAELRDDIEGSLRTLRIDRIDLYWLHRDDAARPVEHFIDALNTFAREGKLRAFGASNWPAARLRAANAYARASGQLGFAANQPFWCLGCRQSRPPPFTGYVKFEADAYRFHRETGLAVIPYTSQANGFFSKLALPPAERPADFARHEFHTPPNLAAGRLVLELARARSVAPSAIVLAYLRSRPFPVVPIVGSRTLAQLEDSAAALATTLTTAELRALEDASQSGLPAD
ncbi:MAG TPA: aldo/keto reductase [Opitutaceae bacterium]|nr:aldo/keto reductase [Opitutaceae bacterium]